MHQDENFVKVLIHEEIKLLLFIYQFISFSGIIHSIFGERLLLEKNRGQSFC